MCTVYRWVSEQGTGGQEDTVKVVRSTRSRWEGEHCTQSVQVYIVKVGTEGEQGKGGQEDIVQVGRRKL